MWAIVHFVDDNSVEIVPSYWISDEKCAWPKNSHAAHKLRNNRVKPNSYEFNYYRVRVLSKNISKLQNFRKFNSL